MPWTINQTRSGFTAIDAQRGIEVSAPTREALNLSVAEIEAVLSKQRNPAPTDEEIEADHRRMRQAESRSSCEETFRYWTGRGPQLVPQQLTIQERFERFHAANPHVYKVLVCRARILKAEGHTKIGIALLVEGARWKEDVQTQNDVLFKISNDYRSRYSRLIMEQEEGLEGFFTVRILGTA